MNEVKDRVAKARAVAETIALQRPTMTAARQKATRLA
jgi:hypothetical protein